jgi:hypothetical protein
MRGEAKSGPRAITFFAVVVATTFFVTACGSEEPAPLPAPPVVATPPAAIPALPAAPVAPVAPVAPATAQDDLTANEQQALSAAMTANAQLEITPENAAAAADALEKEIDADLAAL